MEEAVSDVLAARTHGLDGMSRMVSVSFAVHVGVLAALFVIPQLWLPRHQAPVKVITISLGGTPGPKVPGLTAASARAVEQAIPQPKRPEPTPAATSKPPDTAAAPAKAVTKPTTPAPAPRPAKPSAPDPLRYYTLNNAPTSNKPVTGPQRQTGTAQSETGVKGIGTGLASGGVSGVTLDVPFCCMDYIGNVVDRIKAHWQNSPVKGTNIIKFTIERDGRIEISSIQIEQPSGLTELDLTSRRALLLTGQVGPLPAGFAGPRLTVHLTVEYGGS
jgi:outer membrane biosynthesis protein TonB